MGLTHEFKTVLMFKKTRLRATNTNTIPETKLRLWLAVHRAQTRTCDDVIGELQAGGDVRRRGLDLLGQLDKGVFGGGVPGQPLAHLLAILCYHPRVQMGQTGKVASLQIQIPWKRQKRQRIY